MTYQTLVKKFKNLDENQKIAIAIPVLFLLSCVFKSYIERFRISTDFHWIYVYGSTSALFLCIFLIIFSFTNSILILRDLKMKRFKKALWFLLSFSVFLLTASLIIAIALDIA